MARAKSEKAVDDTVVASKTLENIFGVVSQRIRQLAEDGIVVRESYGKYLLLESTKNYIKFLKASNTSRAMAAEDVVDLDTERALHEHTKRQISEIKLMLIKGQVHKAEDVQYVMTDMFNRFRTQIMSMPSKLAMRLEQKDRLEIKAVLEEELSKALTELSEYKPGDFYSDEHIDIPKDRIEGLAGSEEKD